MYIFLILLFDVLVLYVKCYNLDFEYVVAKKGPDNSFFGFSVVEHSDESNKNNPNPVNWILVGAPKANNTLLKSKYIESGTVFKCNPNDPSPTCTEEVPFDKEISQSDENKTGEWLGVSLKSGGKLNEVVTCAHRYNSYGRSGKFHLLEGKCYQVTQKLIPDVPQTIYSPCSPENSDASKTSDHEYYGQCESGIGLDILPEVTADETTVLIGAAGTKWFSGEFFEMDSSDKWKGQLPPEIQVSVAKGKGKYAKYRSSYFGYALTYGNFFNKNALHIASGGPRHNHYGKVLIYAQKGDDKTKKMVDELPKPSEEKIQIASGYGIALCSIDSDNNKLHELVVGAPFYLSVGAKDRPEHGIVYIYSKSDNENKLVLHKKLQGEEKQGSYSNFGYSVANGGDIDMDGYQDLIVGAPREDDGAGAVYVYRGSVSGTSKRAQRIAAKTVHSGLRDNIGLKGFGRSIGTGVDMDNNGYKDILIGAYLSSHAALLRSRPVIEVSSKLEFHPNQLDTSLKECPFSKAIKNACVKVKFCFNITEPSGKLQKNNKEIKVNYVIEADPIRGTVRDSRVEFVEKQSNKYSFVGNSKIADFICQELGIVRLKYRDDGTVAEYPDIVFKVSYEIPYTDATSKPARSETKVVSLDDYPILRMPAEEDDKGYFITTQLKFKRDCITCIPNLALSSERNNYTLRLGKQDFEFDITIENKGSDPAYSVGLQIDLPKSLQLNEIKDGSNIRCSTRTCQNIINKFVKGVKKVIIVNLMTTDFNPTGMRNISITVTSANGELNSTKADNRLDITFDLKVVADLNLLTTQSTKSLSYEGIVKGESAMKSLEDAGPFVIHKYAVRNEGPDLSPIANVTIDWPYQTKSGKHLLYLVSISNPCVASHINVLNLKSDGSTAGASTAPSIQTRPLYSSKVESSGAPIKRRVRRELPLNVTQPDVETSQSSRRVKRGTILNCTTAQCIKITCILKDIPAFESRTIVITSVLWKPSLLLDYRGLPLTVVSNATVLIGTNASYITDPNPLNKDAELYTIVTPITPAPIPEKIAVWQIALAVVAGVILLTLMVYGLYKVGFFHRTRKQDENGAYEGLIDKRKGENKD